MNNSQDQPLRALGRRSAQQLSGRDALIRAATRCFADNGFEAASVRAIANMAGTAPNLITVHFGGKDGLWLACVETLIEKLGPRLKVLESLNDKVGALSRPELRSRLEQIVAMTAAYYDDNPDLRGFIARGGMEPAPRGLIIAERLLQPIYKKVQPILERAIATGLMAAEHPALLFVTLHAAIGQPDRMAAALEILAPSFPSKNLSGQVARLLSSALLAPERSGS
jgi:AcrR family transcriptional regulator